MNDSTGTGVGMDDRRTFLKRAAAASALAWTAPIVLSAPAQADGVCTPACLPDGTPVLTATASGSCNNSAKQYTVTVNLALAAGSVNCECGGTPRLEPVLLKQTYGVREEGEKVLTGPVDVICLDGTNDECSVPYNVRVTVRITKGNNGNDCNGNTVAVVGVPQVSAAT